MSLSNLSTMIANKTGVKLSKKEVLNEIFEKKFQERVSLLSPIVEELNVALPDYGLKAYLHTDENHLPCPAIHVRNADSATQNMAVYDKISEIILGQGDVAFHSGSCNRHIYSHSGKDALLNHVADTISECVASKRLVSK